MYRDEADILGDRVAIMKAGNVKTSGSSLFLKKRLVNVVHYPLMVPLVMVLGII